MSRSRGKAIELIALCVYLEINCFLILSLLITEKRRWLISKGWYWRSLFKHLRNLFEHLHNCSEHLSCDSETNFTPRLTFCSKKYHRKAKRSSHLKMIWKFQKITRKVSVKKFYFSKIVGFLPVSLLLTLNRFHTLFLCLHCWFWTNKFQLELGYSLKVLIKTIAIHGLTFVWFLKVVVSEFKAWYFFLFIKFIQEMVRYRIFWFFFLKTWNAAFNTRREHNTSGL